MEVQSFITQLSVFNKATKQLQNSTKKTNLRVRNQQGKKKGEFLTSNPKNQTCGHDCRCWCCTPLTNCKHQLELQALILHVAGMDPIYLLSIQRNKKEQQHKQLKRKKTNILQKPRNHTLQAIKKLLSKNNYETNSINHKREEK